MTFPIVCTGPVCGTQAGDARQITILSMCFDAQYKLNLALATMVAVLRHTGKLNFKQQFINM